jgi:RNA polymerase sigma factor (sigma-70 family)
MPTTNSTLLDEKVLDQLIGEARPIIASFARSSGLTFDDLYQEVAMKLVYRWSQIQEAERTAAYAHVVVRNLLIDKYRQAKRHHDVSMNALEELGVQF